jgi:hypothetical protein
MLLVSKHQLEGRGEVKLLEIWGENMWMWTIQEWIRLFFHRFQVHVAPLWAIIQRRRFGQVQWKGRGRKMVWRIISSFPTVFSMSRGTLQHNARIQWIREELGWSHAVAYVFHWPRNSL